MKRIFSAIVAISLVRAIAALSIHIEAWRPIYFDQSYHLYYGILLVLVGMIVKYYQQLKWSQILVGAGLGLIADDIAVLLYLFYGPPLDPISDYWSPLFVLPMLCGLGLIGWYEYKCSPRTL